MELLEAGDVGGNPGIGPDRLEQISGRFATEEPETNATMRDGGLALSGRSFRTLIRGHGGAVRACRYSRLAVGREFFGCRFEGPRSDERWLSGLRSGVHLQ